MSYQVYLMDFSTYQIEKQTDLQQINFFSTMKKRNPMKPMNNLAQPDPLYLYSVDNVDNFQIFYASLSLPG